MDQVSRMDKWEEEGTAGSYSLLSRSFWYGGPLGQSCGIGDCKIPINSTPAGDSDDGEFTKENFVLGPPLIVCVNLSKPHHFRAPL